MLNKMIIFISLSALTLAFIQSCDTTEPKNDPGITIQEVDVAVREVYIYVSFQTLRHRTVSVFRNGKRISDFICASMDTIIVDTCLIENTNYKYVLKESNNNSYIDSSNEIEILTLIENKTDFVWDSYNIKTGTNSTLSDIHIINKNDIWVVGEFYFDSDVAYGFLHWDGIEWKHFRLYAEVPPTNYKTNIYPTGVFAFGSDDLWFSAGSVFRLHSGLLTSYWISNFSGNPNPTLEPGQFARKIWGDKISGEVYVCGDKGALAIFSNGVWNPILTNTDSDITELWGFENPISKSTEIICAATKFSYSSNIMIKVSKGRSVTVLPWNKNTFLLALWTNKGFPIYAGGSQYYSNSTQHWELIDVGESLNPYKVMGSSLNNIFIVGANSKVFHFNGISWRNVSHNINSESNLTHISIKDNIVAIGGENNGSISINITQ